MSKLTQINLDKIDNDMAEVSYEIGAIKTFISLCNYKLQKFLNGNNGNHVKALQFVRKEYEAGLRMLEQHNLWAEEDKSQTPSLAQAPAPTPTPSLPPAPAEDGKEDGEEGDDGTESDNDPEPAKPVQPEKKQKVEPKVIVDDDEINRTLTAQKLYGNSVIRMAHDKIFPKDLSDFQLYSAVVYFAPRTERKDMYVNGEILEEQIFEWMDDGAPLVYAFLMGTRRTSLKGSGLVCFKGSDRGCPLYRSQKDGETYSDLARSLGIRTKLIGSEKRESLIADINVADPEKCDFKQIIGDNFTAVQVQAYVGLLIKLQFCELFRATPDEVKTNPRAGVWTVPYAEGDDDENNFLGSFFMKAKIKNDEFIPLTEEEKKMDIGTSEVRSLRNKYGITSNLRKKRTKRRKNIKNPKTMNQRPWKSYVSPKIKGIQKSSPVPRQTRIITTHPLLPDQLEKNGESG